MTKKNAQHEQKKLRDTLYSDTTEFWRSKEIMLLGKPWKGI